MIKHIVLMKFKTDTKDTEIDRLSHKLGELPERIDAIKQYQFGRDIVHSDRSFDFGLVSEFINPDELKRYQNHPQHLKVVELIGQICESVKVVDFKIE